MAIGIQVTIDANDPAKLSAFWAQALDYEPEAPPPGFESWDAWCDAMNIPAESRNDYAAVVDPAGAGARIFFQRVPEGKVVKNRLHLDVNASGATHDPDLIAVHVAKLESLGAHRVAEFDEVKGRWVVMLDPEGNEFCVQ